MRRASGALGALVVAGSLVTASAAGAQQTIKQLMGDNYAGMQTILASLMTSSYTAVPSQADVIRDHATQLTREVPAGVAPADRDRFLALAYALQTHAESLKSISQVLMEHDKEQMARTGGALAADTLRESLAAHYGGMVVTCVSCHDQFRQRKVGQ